MVHIFENSLLSLEYDIKIHLHIGCMIVFICIKYLIIVLLSYFLDGGGGGNVRASASSRFKVKTESTGEDSAGN